MTARSSVATDLLVLPRLYPYQRRLLNDHSRDVCIVSSTQVGKTFAMACYILANAWEDRVISHPSWWLAPTYNQVVQGFRLVVAIASSAGILEANTTSPYPSVHISNGKIIEFRSWEREQNLMGTTISCGVVDEAGQLTPEAQAAISSRRSGTMGPLRYIGNPGLVAGPFRRLCALGEHAATPGSEWAGTYSIHRWTWIDKRDALALNDPARAAAYEKFISQERSSLPDFEFRRLYEAEWTQDEAAVFRNVDKCTTLGDADLLEPGVDKFVLGVDVAQSVDYLAVVSYAEHARRLELRYRARHIGYSQAAIDIDRIAKQLDAVAIIEDNGPGIALIQELRRLGTPMRGFTTTSQSKQELILSLASDIQEQRVTIADHAPMPYEFSIYRYERSEHSSAGLYRYSAPPGEHDDTVIAAALARYGASRRVNLADYGWV